MTLRGIKDSLKKIKGDLKIVFEPPLIYLKAAFARVLKILHVFHFVKMDYSNRGEGH